MENILPSQNNLIQDSERKEENGYPVPAAQQNKDKGCEGTQ
jgi:hypothetical protein